MPFGYDIVCNFRAHTISQYNFEKGFTSMKTQKHLFLYAILVFAFSLCLSFLLPGMDIRAERAIDIASRYSLSNNKMLAGAAYTVAELFDLIIVPSSAAATYMLADLIEPDPDKFVTLLCKFKKRISARLSNSCRSI